MLGWDTMISFTFMCNETGKYDLTLTHELARMVMLHQDPTLNYNHHHTSCSMLWLGLAEYVSTHLLLTHPHTDLGTEEDQGYDEEAHHKDQELREESKHRR